MEGAYDHIQEEQIKLADTPLQDKQDPTLSFSHEPGSLNADLQDAYKTFASSQWGTTLGSFWGSVRSQGEGYINEARKEAEIARGEALKGFTDLTSGIVSRAKSLSLSESAAKGPPVGSTEVDQGSDKDSSHDQAKSDADGLISRFKSEAAKRLHDIQKAEDAADAALLTFGSSIRDFLRDAVTVTAPAEAEGDTQGGVMFESKDAEGKRVIHTTRFDAQLHVIHCSLDSFTKDPASEEYEKWNADGTEAFKVDEKTDSIASDLAKYEELRRAMEKLVPERVDYKTFWMRYYFLRMVVESEERRRREMLKGAAQGPNEAELAWDEESDEESSTPQATSQVSVDKITTATTSLSKSTPSAGKQKSSADDFLKVAEPRRSQDEKSQPDSESSYDLVSGATSRGASSPKEEQPPSSKKATGKKDDSDEEDWE